MRRFRFETGLLLLSVALLATLLFKHISYPLLWQDEGETVMFATRILAYGYPKVHGERNVLYEFGPNVSLGIKETCDAYIGTTWGHFYFAVPGVLWASGVGDLYARTARLRLPFAVAGVVGLAVWLLAVTPVFRGERRRATLFAALFFSLAAVSISLILHLREVRYYALFVLLSGGIVRLQLQHRLFATIRLRRYVASLAILLFLLFHTFYSAYFIFTALLGLDGVVAALRNDASAAARIRRAAVELSPLLAAAAFVAPFLVFFETLSVASGFSDALGITLAGYLENVSMFLSHFWRHELLAPVLACRLAVVGVDLAGRRRGLAPPPGAERRAALWLLFFVVGYVALTCLNPLVYERYFVILSPVFILVFLLDAFALWDAVPGLAPAPGRRRVALLTSGAILALFLATSGARIEDVRGRIAEIAHPYRGPLDFAIAYLAESTPRPQDLVIATNYENHPLMYYLGSHVIVGTNLNNILRDRLLDPDVVIDRRRWPRGRRELREFLARGGYESRTFPVRDLHFNNIPALTRSRSTPDSHHFRTARPATEGERFEIFRKRRERPSERLHPAPESRG